MDLEWRMDGAGAPSGGARVRVRLPASLARYARVLFPDYREPAPEPAPRAPESEGKEDGSTGRGGSPGDALPPPDIRVEERVRTGSSAGESGGGGPATFGVRGPGGGTWDAPDASAAMAAFEVLLAETLLRRLEGVRIVHGAGVLLEGSAVVLPGHGGAGKSTLAAALASAGVPVHGDDVVLVDGGSGTISSFHRLLKVPEDSRVRLGLPRPGTPLDALWPGSSLYRPEDLGSRWAPSARVAAVLFPVRDGSAGPRVVPLDGPEAMRRLLAQALLVERARAEDFEAAARLLEGARTAELRYGEAAEAAAFLRSWDPGSA